MGCTSSIAKSPIGAPAEVVTVRSVWDGKAPLNQWCVWVLEKLEKAERDDDGLNPLLYRKPTQLVEAAEPEAADTDLVISEEEPRFGVPQPLEMGFGQDFQAPPGSVPDTTFIEALDGALDGQRPPQLMMGSSPRISDAGSDLGTARSVQSDMSEGTKQLMEAERLNIESADRSSNGNPGRYGWADVNHRSRVSGEVPRWKRLWVAWRCGEVRENLDWWRADTDALLKCGKVVRRFNALDLALGLDTWWSWYLDKKAAVKVARGAVKRLMQQSLLWAYKEWQKKLHEMREMQFIMKRCIVRMKHMELLSVFKKLQNKAWVVKELTRLRRLALWHYRVWQWRHLRWWKRKRTENELQKKDPSRATAVFAGGFERFIRGLLETAFRRIDINQQGTIAIQAFQVVCQAFGVSFRDTLAASGLDSALARNNARGKAELSISAVSNSCDQATQAMQSAGQAQLAERTAAMLAEVSSSNMITVERLALLAPQAEEIWFEFSMAIGIQGEARWKHQLAGLRQLVLELKTASRACLQAEVLWLYKTMASMEAEHVEGSTTDSLELERAAKDAAELATRMESLEHPIEASMLSSLSSRLFTASAAATAAEVDASLKTAQDAIALREYRISIGKPAEEVTKKKFKKKKEAPLVKHSVLCALMPDPILESPALIAKVTATEQQRQQFEEQCDQQHKDLTEKYKPASIPKFELQRFERQRKDGRQVLDEELHVAQGEVVAATLRDKAARQAREMENDIYVMEMLDMEAFSDVVITQLLPGMTAAQAMRSLQKLVMLIGDRQHELGLKVVPTKPVKHGGQLCNPCQLDVEKYFEHYCSAHGIHQFNNKQLAALITSFCEQCGVRLPFRHQAAQSAVSERSLNCVMFDAAAAHTARRMRGFSLPDGTVPLTSHQFACLMMRRPWRQLLPLAIREQLVLLLMKPVSARLFCHGSRAQSVWEELGVQYGQQVCGERVSATIRALWKGADCVAGSVTGGATRVLFDSYAPVWHRKKLLSLYHELIRRKLPSKRNLFLKSDQTRCPFRSLYNADVIESHFRAGLAAAVEAVNVPRQEMQLAADNLIEEFESKQLTSIGAAPVRKVLKAAEPEEYLHENLEKAHKEIRKSARRLTKRDPPLNPESERLLAFNWHTDRMLALMKGVAEAEVKVFEGIPLAQHAERIATKRVEALMGLRIRRAARLHAAKVEQMAEGQHKQAALEAIAAAPRVELSFVGFIEMLHMRPWSHWANEEVVKETELFWRQAFAQQVGFLPPCSSTQLDTHASAVAQQSLRRMRIDQQHSLRMSLTSVQARISDKESCEFSLMEDKLAEWHAEKVAVDAHNATRTRQPVIESLVPRVMRGDMSKALQFESQVSRLKVEAKFVQAAHLMVQQPWRWLLPPGVEQELLAYLIPARCFERSFKSQILHHQTSNRNPPPLQYLLRDLRVHEIYFALVHNHGIPMVQLKKGSFGSAQVARATAIIEVELPPAEALVAELRDEIEDCPTRGEKDKLRKPLSKAKRVRDKLQAELEACNPTEGSPEWQASQQTVEAQCGRTLQQRAALAATSVMSQIVCAMPATVGKRMHAVFARQLRRSSLEEEGKVFTFVEFVQLFVRRPWNQALPLGLRQEVNAMASAEACKREMDRRAHETKLKESAFIGDQAALTAAAAGFSYPTQITIAAKVTAGELSKRGCVALECATQAALVAYRYKAELGVCVACAARAATLNVVSSQATQVAKIVVVEGWKCHQFVDLCDKVRTHFSPKQVDLTERVASIATQAAQEASAMKPIVALRTELQTLIAQNKQLVIDIDAASARLGEASETPFAKLEENLTESTVGAAADNEQIQSAIVNLQRQQEEVLKRMSAIKKALSAVEAAVLHAPFAAVGMATVVLGGKTPQAAKASASLARESGAAQEVINAAAAASAVWCAIEAGKEPAQVGDAVVSAVMQAGGDGDDVTQAKDSGLLQALQNRTGLLSTADDILRIFDDLSSLNAQSEVTDKETEAASERLGEIDLPGPDQDAAQSVVKELETQQEEIQEKIQATEVELEAQRKVADGASSDEQELIMALQDAPHAEFQFKFEKDFSTIRADTYERQEFEESVLRDMKRALGDFDTKRLQILKVADPVEEAAAAAQQIADEVAAAEAVVEEAYEQATAEVDAATAEVDAAKEALEEALSSGDPAAIANAQGTLANAESHMSDAAFAVNAVSKKRKKKRRNSRDKEEESAPAEGEEDEETAPAIIEVKTIYMNIRVAALDENDDSEDPLELVQAVLILWSQLCDERSNLRNGAVTSSLTDDRSSKFILHVEQPVEVGSDEEEVSTAADTTHNSSAELVDVEAQLAGADDLMPEHADNAKSPDVYATFEQRIVSFAGTCTVADLWQWIQTLSLGAGCSTGSSAAERWLAAVARQLRAHPNGCLNLVSLATFLCSSMPWRSLMTTRQNHELKVLLVKLSIGPALCAGLTREVFNTLSPVADADSVNALFSRTLKAASGHDSCISAYSHGRTVAILNQRLRRSLHTASERSLIQAASSHVLSPLSCPRCGTPHPKLHLGCPCRECGHQHEQASASLQTLAPALRFSDWLTVLSTRPWCDLLPASLHRANFTIAEQMQNDQDDYRPKLLNLSDLRCIFTAVNARGAVNAQGAFSEASTFLMLLDVVAAAQSKPSPVFIDLKPSARLMALINRRLRKMPRGPMFTRFLMALNARPWRSTLSASLQSLIRAFCLRQSGRSPMVMVAQEAFDSIVNREDTQEIVESIKCLSDRPLLCFPESFDRRMLSVAGKHMRTARLNAKHRSKACPMLRFVHFVRILCQKPWRGLFSASAAQELSDFVLLFKPMGGLARELFDSLSQGAEEQVREMLSTSEQPSLSHATHSRAAAVLSRRRRALQGEQFEFEHFVDLVCSRPFSSLVSKAVQRDAKRFWLAQSATGGSVAACLQTMGGSVFNGHQLAALVQHSLDASWQRTSTDQFFKHFLQSTRVNATKPQRSRLAALLHRSVRVQWQARKDSFFVGELAQLVISSKLWLQLLKEESVQELTQIRTAWWQGGGKSRMQFESTLSSLKRLNRHDQSAMGVAFTSCWQHKPSIVHSTPPLRSYDQRRLTAIAAQRARKSNSLLFSEMISMTRTRRPWNQMRPQPFSEELAPRTHIRGMSVSRLRALADRWVANTQRITQCSSLDLPTVTWMLVQKPWCQLLRHEDAAALRLLHDAPQCDLVRDLSISSGRREPLVANPAEVNLILWDTLDHTINQAISHAWVDATAEHRLARHAFDTAGAMLNGHDVLCFILKVQSLDSNCMRLELDSGTALRLEAVLSRAMRKRGLYHLDFLTLSQLVASNGVPWWRMLPCALHAEFVDVLMPIHISGFVDDMVSTAVFQAEEAARLKLEAQLEEMRRLDIDKHLSMFLADIGCSDFAANLAGSGVRDMKTLMTVTRKDLEEMEIPPEHELTMFRLAKIWQPNERVSAEYIAMVNATEMTDATWFQPYQLWSRSRLNAGVVATMKSYFDLLELDEGGYIKEEALSELDHKFDKGKRFRLDQTELHKAWVQDPNTQGPTVQRVSQLRADAFKWFLREVVALFEAYSHRTSGEDMDIKFFQPVIQQLVLSEDDQTDILEPFTGQSTIGRAQFAQVLAERCLPQLTQSQLRERMEVLVESSNADLRLIYSSDDEDEVFVDEESDEVLECWHPYPTLRVWKMTTRQELKLRGYFELLDWGSFGGYLRPDEVANLDDALSAMYTQENDDGDAAEDKVQLLRGRAWERFLDQALIAFDSIDVGGTGYFPTAGLGPVAKAFGHSLVWTDQVLDNQRWRKVNVDRFIYFLLRFCADGIAHSKLKTSTQKLVIICQKCQTNQLHGGCPRRWVRWRQTKLTLHSDDPEMQWLLTVGQFEADPRQGLDRRLLVAAMLMIERDPNVVKDMTALLVLLDLKGDGRVRMGADGRAAMLSDVLQKIDECWGQNAADGLLQLARSVADDVEISELSDEWASVGFKTFSAIIVQLLISVHRRLDNKQTEVIAVNFVKEIAGSFGRPADDVLDDFCPDGAFELDIQQTIDLVIVHATDGCTTQQFQEGLCSLVRTSMYFTDQALCRQLVRDTILTVAQQCSAKAACAEIFNEIVFRASQGSAILMCSELVEEVVLSASNQVSIQYPAVAQLDQLQLMASTTLTDGNWISCNTATEALGIVEAICCNRWPSYLKSQMPKSSARLNLEQMTIRALRRGARRREADCERLRASSCYDLLEAHLEGALVTSHDILNVLSGSDIQASSEDLEGMDNPLSVLSTIELLEEQDDKWMSANEFVALCLGRPYIFEAIESACTAAANTLHVRESELQSRLPLDASLSQHTEFQVLRIKLRDQGQVGSSFISLAARKPLVHLLPAGVARIMPRYCLTNFAQKRHELREERRTNMRKRLKAAQKYVIENWPDDLTSAALKCDRELELTNLVQAAGYAKAMDSRLKSVWFREMQEGFKAAKIAAAEAAAAEEHASVEDVTDIVLSPLLLLPHLPQATAKSVIRLFNALDKENTGAVTAGQLARLGVKLHHAWSNAENYKLNQLLEMVSQGGRPIALPEFEQVFSQMMLMATDLLNGFNPDIPEPADIGAIDAAFKEMEARMMYRLYRGEMGNMGSEQLLGLVAREVLQRIDESLGLDILVKDDQWNLADDKELAAYPRKVRFAATQLQDLSVQISDQVVPALQTLSRLLHQRETSASKLNAAIATIQQLEIKLKEIVNKLKLESLQRWLQQRQPELTLEEVSASEIKRLVLEGINQMYGNPIEELQKLTIPQLCSKVDSPDRTKAVIMDVEVGIVQLQILLGKFGAGDLIHSVIKAFSKATKKLESKELFWYAGKLKEITSSLIDLVSINNELLAFGRATEENAEKEEAAIGTCTYVAYEVLQFCDTLKELKLETEASEVREISKSIEFVEACMISEAGTLAASTRLKEIGNALRESVYVEPPEPEITSELGWWMWGEAAELTQADRIRMLFDSMDTDDNGWVYVEYFKSMGHTLHEHWGSEQWLSLMSLVDTSVKRQKVAMWVRSQMTMRAALIVRPEPAMHRVADIMEPPQPPPERQDPAPGRDMKKLTLTTFNKIGGLFEMLDWDVWASSGEDWKGAGGQAELAAALTSEWGHAYDKLLVSLIDREGYTRAWIYPKFLSQMLLINFKKLSQGTASNFVDPVDLHKVCNCFGITLPEVHDNMKHLRGGQWFEWMTNEFIEAIERNVAMPGLMDIIVFAGEQLVTSQEKKADDADEVDHGPVLSAVNYQEMTSLLDQAKALAQEQEEQLRKMSLKQESDMLAKALEGIVAAQASEFLPSADLDGKKVESAGEASIHASIGLVDGVNELLDRKVSKVGEAKEILENALRVSGEARRCLNLELLRQAIRQTEDPFAKKNLEKRLDKLVNPRDDDNVSDVSTPVCSDASDHSDESDEEHQERFVSKKKARKQVKYDAKQAAHDEAKRLIQIEELKDRLWDLTGVARREAEKDLAVLEGRDPDLERMPFYVAERLDGVFDIMDLPNKGVVKRAKERLIEMREEVPSAEATKTELERIEAKALEDFELVEMLSQKAQKSNVSLLDIFNSAGDITNADECWLLLRELWEAMGLHPPMLLAGIDQRSRHLAWRAVHQIRRRKQDTGKKLVAAEIAEFDAKIETKEEEMIKMNKKQKFYANREIAAFKEDIAEREVQLYRIKGFEDEKTKCLKAEAKGKSKWPTLPYRHFVGLMCRKPWSAVLPPSMVQHLRKLHSDLFKGIDEDKEEKPLTSSEEERAARALVRVQECQKAAQSARDEVEALLAEKEECIDVQTRKKGWVDTVDFDMQFANILSDRTSDVPPYRPNWNKSQREMLVDLVETHTVDEDKRLYPKEQRISKEAFVKFFAHQCFAAYDHLDWDGSGSLQPADMAEVSRVFKRDHAVTLKQLHKIQRLSSDSFMKFVNNVCLEGLGHKEVNLGLSKLIRLNGAAYRHEEAAHIRAVKTWRCGSLLRYELGWQAWNNETKRQLQMRQEACIKWHEMKLWFFTLQYRGYTQGVLDTKQGLAHASVKHLFHTQLRSFKGWRKTCQEYRQLLWLGRKAFMCWAFPDRDMFPDILVTEIPFFNEVWKQDKLGRDAAENRRQKDMRLLAESMCFGADAEKPTSLGGLAIIPEHVPACLFSLVDTPLENCRKGYLNVADLDCLENVLCDAWGRERMFLLFSLFDRDGNTSITKKTFLTYMKWMETRIMNEAALEFLDADIEAEPEAMFKVTIPSHLLFFNCLVQARPDGWFRPEAKAQAAEEKAQAASVKRAEVLAVTRGEKNLKLKEVRRLPQLSNTDVALMDEVFTVFDRDLSGFLDEDELVEITYAVKQYWSKSEQDLLMAVGNRNREVLQPQFRRYLAQLLVRIFDRLDAAYDKNGTLSEADAIEAVGNALGQSRETVRRYMELHHMAIGNVWQRLGPDEWQRLVLMSSLNFEQIDETFTKTCDEVKTRNTLFDREEHEEWVAMKIKAAGTDRRVQMGKQLEKGLRELIVAAASVHDPTAVTQKATVENVRQIQKQSWENKDHHGRRSKEKVLLPELREGPMEGLSKSSGPADEEWLKELKPLLNQGYKSYAGNPNSAMEKERTAILQKRAADLARRERIRKAVALDEKAAALDALNNRSSQAREERMALNAKNASKR